jgi:murein L,D-transpeptidase YcbB/YkuD
MNKIILFMQQFMLIGLFFISNPGQAINLPLIVAAQNSSYDNPIDNTSITSTSSSIALKNYTRLQQILPIYENAVAHPWPTISSKGPLLKIGIHGMRVVAIRERLRATGELKESGDFSSDVFDDELEDSVIYFQTCHGLKADGVIGPATLAELNVPAQERLKQIQINMSRWAKLSNELSDRYILINVPAYELDLVEHGNTILSMKAIVGKPTRPTPDIESTVTRIVFNPYWNVPRLIAQKDIVPKILADQGYLDEMHIKVINREEDSAPEVDQNEIDWQAAAVEGFRYHFRQDPGENNALGLVKFEFQNSHDVYMHDTPAKNLFEADKRAFSSGCIRLERPFDLVSYLMEDNPKWNNDRIEDVLEKGKTTYVKVTPIPVIITYLTTWVDDNGDVQFREDIYGRDTAVS